VFLKGISKIKNMPLKLVALNTDHGGRPIEKLIDFLKKENAEILCLQEVYNGVDSQLENNFRSLRIFKEKLSYPYCSFFPTHAVIIHNKKAPSGNLILSKFPIIDSSFTFFNSYYQEFDFRGWFEKGDYRFVPKGLQEAIIDIDDKEINIFNIHGPWGFDGKDNQERFQALSIIEKKLENKKNIILAGDFNLNPQTQFVQRLEKKLINVFKNKIKTSFNIKRKKEKGDWENSIVDMVFVSKEIKIIDSYQPQVDISDHLPLVIKFSF
jgi:endonuclease/exonuclease/phosphatase family metal-dependent hydrolase